MATHTPNALSDRQRAMMALDEIANLQRQAFAAKLAQARVGAAESDDAGAAGVGAPEGTSFKEHVSGLNDAADRIARANGDLGDLMQQLAQERTA